MTNHETIRNIYVGVDIQNDFISGSLAVNDGEQVVTPSNELANAVRQANGTVAWTRDWHPTQTPHFADYGGVWPVHCVADTDGAAFHSNLEVQPSDIIISKGMGQTDGYSGWEGVSADGQNLETLITPHQYEKVRVFIGGLATDYCVKATTLDIAAHFEDNERVTTYLIRDAIQAVNLHETDGQAALDEIAKTKVITVATAEAIALTQGDK